MPKLTTNVILFWSAPRAWSGQDLHGEHVGPLFILMEAQQLQFSMTWEEIEYMRQWTKKFQYKVNKKRQYYYSTNNEYSNQHSFSLSDNFNECFHLEKSTINSLKVSISLWQILSFQLTPCHLMPFSTTSSNHQLFWFATIWLLTIGFPANNIQLWHHVFWYFLFHSPQLQRSGYKKIVKSVCTIYIMLFYTVLHTCYILYNAVVTL